VTAVKKALKFVLGILATPVVLVLFLAFCVVFAFLSPVLMVLPAILISMPFSPPSPQDSIGEYRCEVFCEYAVFQDGTSYAEYVYEAPSFEDNPYFRPVTAEDSQMLLEFVDDFEGWVNIEADSTNEDARTLWQSYGYDPGMLSENDWFFLKTKDPEDPFMNYDLYIYDAELQTLFYMESIL